MIFLKHFEGAMTMSTSSIEDTLAAKGYAKVIVALNDFQMGAAASSAQAKGSIENYFMIPDVAQAESLAVSARNFASRSFKRAEPPTSRRVRVYPHLGLAIGYVDSGGLASLEADPQIGKVEKAPELSLIRPVVVEEAKLGTGPSWGVKRLKADLLWAAGLTGKGVLVGHLDTGVDASHPALKGAIGKFAEFDLAGDHVPNAQPSDSDEHGTHTAGTIVGRSGLKGAFGMAPEAQLASAMVIEGGQVIDRILAGMDWVIGEGVRIMSMSLGLRGFTPAFQTVIDALRAANVLPVIAVGNEGPNTSRSPGNYANVLAVGAMDARGQVADFSGSEQFARTVNPLCPALVAPGVEILSCVPGGKYKTMNGSSMATPHVAGLAALLLQAKPTATADELERAIVGSCRLPAGMPQARGSHGVPDAVRAFQLLTGSQLPVAVAAPRRTPKRSVRGKTPAGRAAGRVATKGRSKAKKLAASRRKHG
jgi:subtilisin family serine protease